MKLMSVTINDINNPNYGNKLQTYAVMQILHNWDENAVSLCFEYEKELSLSTKLKNNFHKITNYAFAKKYGYWINLEKNNKFKKFDNRFLNVVYTTDLSKLNSQYDYFITGSDQVWNPSWYCYNELKKSAYLLSFASPKKRISLSPSFGLSKLPDEWKPYFKTQLAKFSHISVREEAGVEIIKKLIGKTVPVLIDPTMMLEKESWSEISVKPQHIKSNKPYVLTYFLGEKSQDELSLEIKFKSEGLEIYNLADITCKDLYTVDPCEFIWLIEHSKLVLTDSFHACVFSFLFSKPFKVYSRKSNDGNMTSRLHTFLAKFDLIRKFEDSNSENELFECDYTNGFEILQTERQNVWDYLKKALNQ